VCFRRRAPAPPPRARRPPPPAAVLMAASPPEQGVPAPPPCGRLSFFSFLEVFPHGTVLVAALAEEVPAAVPSGPAAHLDARSVGRSYGSQFSAPGHVPGRCRPPRGHGGGLQPRRQAGRRRRQPGIG